MENSSTWNIDGARSQQGPFYALQCRFPTFYSELLSKKDHYLIFLTRFKRKMIEIFLVSEVYTSK